MTTTYPRETVEFQPVYVTVDELPVTSFDVQITAHNQRPTSAGWTAAVVLDGNLGVMVAELTLGLYRVWARVIGNPEQPVIDCGLIAIS